MFDYKGVTASMATISEAFGKDTFTRAQYDALPNREGILSLGTLVEHNAVTVDHSESFNVEVTVYTDGKGNVSKEPTDGYIAITTNVFVGTRNFYKVNDVDVVRKAARYQAKGERPYVERRIKDLTAKLDRARNELAMLDDILK